MKHDVSHAITHALSQVAHARGLADDAFPLVNVERPKKREHGDYATNAAMTFSKRFGVPPRELAELLKASLVASGKFAAVDIAGPGFINLKLAPAMFHDALREVLEAGRAWGRAPSATGERINLEFVSANPTGPLHLAHGRGAVTGDVVARLLEANGHRVIREYYVNDAGNQIRLLAESVIAKAKGTADPEGGYGANQYVTDLGRYLQGQAASLDVESIGRRAVAAVLDGYPGFPGIRETLRALGIQHDVWSSERQLHEEGRVGRAIDAMRAKDLLKKARARDDAPHQPAGQEGEAEVFESTRFGDDKDRVVFKSDGAHTYFASDIAYHKDKLDRGFDRLIDVWGADHHGYIPRVRAAMRALGLPDDHFEVILVQMVSLVKNGEPYRMGKRLGNFITIDEVLEDIDAATGRAGSGRDALRYYFCARRTDAQLEIDVEIAKKQSLDNPVYYLQYGHARLCAILRKAKEELSIDVDTGVTEDLSPLVHADELELVQRLVEWPDALCDAGRERAPHKIVGYLTDLAQAFQSYYTRLKNENDTILPRSGERQDGSWKARDDGAFAKKVRARLAWVRAIRDVYAAGLELLGVRAPDRMERPTSARTEREEDDDADDGKS